MTAEEKLMQRVVERGVAFSADYTAASLAIGLLLEAGIPIRATVGPSARHSGAGVWIRIDEGGE